MKKEKKIAIFTISLAIIMISAGIMIEKSNSLFMDKTINIQKIDIKSITTSANNIIGNEEINVPEENKLLTKIKMNTAPAAVIIPPRVEVYEGMTLEEVANQINKNLKNDITGKGLTIASKSIELGVDPFVASAIILHETGCGQNHCSNIARNCYNFGGQKGTGCGAYQRYNSIDEGLEGMISNLYRNYYSKGLVTIETIGPKYAESSEWVSKINWYVNKIKSA